MSYIQGFAFFIFFFIVASLRAQPTVIDEKEFSFYQSVNGDQSNSDLQDYFVAISKSQGKLLSSLQISFSYLLNQKIVALDSVNYAIVSEIKQLRIEGDKFYRLIDVADIIVPDKFSAQIYIHRCDWNRGELIKTPIDTINLIQDPLINRMGYFRMDTLFFTDTVKNMKYVLEWNALNLGFSSAVIRSFNQFSALCDAYYSEIPKIQDWSKKVDQIDVDSVDFVQFSNIELKEVEFAITQLENESYPMKLNLFRYDPANFIGELQNLKQKSEKKRYSLNALLVAVDALFYEKGMQYFINNDYGKAKKYFEKSLALNPYYAASQFRLAEMYYRKGLIDTSSVLLVKMSEMTFPSAILQSEAQQFCKTVYEALLAEGKRLNDRGEFYEAIGKLENAKALCDKYNNTFCNDLGIRMLSESHYGLYESFLTIATKAINNARYEIAETYIEQSLQYQKDHSSYIISNNASYELLRNLVQSYKNEINHLIRNVSFESANEKLKNLEALIQKYGVEMEENTTELKIKIQQGIYNEKIRNASYWISKKNYERAEKELLQAKEFIMNNDLKADSGLWYSNWLIVKQHEYSEIIATVLKKWRKSPCSREDYSQFLRPARLLEFTLPLNRWDSLIFYSQPYAKVDIVQYYHLAISEIDNGDSINAFLYKAKAEYEANFWNLSQWDTLSILKNEFDVLDFSRRCEKHRIHQQLMLEDAKIKIQSQLFAEALLVLENCKRDTKKNIECGIDDQEIFRLIQDILPANQYLELIEKSKLAGNNGVFSLCINTYVEAENLFYRSGISKFGTPAPNPSTFFSEISDETIIYRAVDYFIEWKRYDEALNVLMILKKRGFSASLTKRLQERLGYKLAVRDKLANPTLDYRVEVLKYSEGEEYFRTLVKNYFKTWKKISR